MDKVCRASETQTDHQAQETFRKIVHSLRRGDRCPQCGRGSMDYDGLLNLSCPVCGYSDASGGSFT